MKLGFEGPVCRFTPGQLIRCVQEVTRLLTRRCPRAGVEGTLVEGPLAFLGVQEPLEKRQRFPVGRPGRPDPVADGEGGFCSAIWAASAVF